MVGAITTLVLVVAVFLAYNANNGLPFVPVYRVAVDVPNGARVTKSNEVRIGGHRVGVVESIVPIRTTPSGQVAQAGTTDTSSSTQSDTCCVAAELNLKLDKSAQPLPVDSIFRIRYKSTFGLKFLEIVRGVSTQTAPDGYTFNGLDDHGDCALPIDPQTFLASETAASKDGCFQPQTEFDAIANTFNRKTRNAGRQNLMGFGDAFSARGASLNEAIDSLSPLFRYLRPVAKNLADPNTQLERFITASARAASIVAPVAVQQSELFTHGADTFAAISADPAALQATISTGVPLLQQGPGQLARQRPFLADFEVLANRLRPGIQQLRLALPDLNSAIKIGTPTLLRTPPINAKLRQVLVQLQKTVRPGSDTKLALQRLKETFDTAKPLANFVVPAQTVCNYWNYFFSTLPNALSDKDQVGYSFRQSGIGFPLGSTQVGIGPSNVTIAGQAEAGLAGYSGIQANGRVGSVPNPADAGKFAPFASPIVQGHPYAPTGQPTSADANGGRTPDCQPGQSGYYFGDARVPGQPKNNPAQAIPDIPGSRGVTDLYYKKNGTRTLKDTRIPAHQP
jgi:ABC-type transporter Mla subunit MlaD